MKITIVGDGMVGKTCLLVTYVQNEFPSDNEPCELFLYRCNVGVDKIIDGKMYALTLWDTIAQEDYDRLRPLCYGNTECFLLCYSISSKTSFANVLTKWYPEIRHFSPSVPIILVGTKSDLRVSNSEKFVTYAEAESVKHKIKAYALVECSAKQKQNYEDVFHEAVRAVGKAPPSRSRVCTLL